MPTTFTVVCTLIVLLLALGGLGTARRLARNRERGKGLGKARPGERADL